MVEEVWDDEGVAPSLRSSCRERRGNGLSARFRSASNRRFSAARRWMGPAGPYTRDGVAAEETPDVSAMSDGELDPPPCNRPSAKSACSACWMVSSRMMLPPVDGAHEPYDVPRGTGPSVDQARSCT